MPASQVMRMSGVGLKMLQVDKTAIAEGGSTAVQFYGDIKTVLTLPFQRQSSIKHELKLRALPVSHLVKQSLCTASKGRC